MYNDVFELRRRKLYSLVFTVDILGKKLFKYKCSTFFYNVPCFLYCFLFCIFLYFSHKNLFKSTLVFLTEYRGYIDLQ